MPPQDERNAMSIVNRATDVTNDNDVTDDANDSNYDSIPMNKVLEFLCLSEVKQMADLNDTREKADDLKRTDDVTCTATADKPNDNVVQDTPTVLVTGGDDVTQDGEYNQEPIVDYTNYEFYNLMFGRHVSQHRTQ